jgi:hypothetical protein
MAATLLLGDRGAAGDTGGGRGWRRLTQASLGYLIGLPRC